MNYRIHRKRLDRSAFTLIELLLVMVILAILAAVIVPKFVGRSEQAKKSAATSDIATLKGQLDAFEVDNGKYPATEEGLQALVSKPSGDYPNWKKPYVDKLPTDPWGHPYIYRCPGTNGKDFDIISCGPDGHEGGGDDITN
jgi:general secretion pathway protein G